MKALNQWIALILCCLSWYAQAQNMKEINAAIGLSDTLTYENEIRIYQSESITNYSSLLRLYEESEDNWKVTYDEHFAKVPGNPKERVETHRLKGKQSLHYVFLALLRSYIDQLPDQRSIEWKLKERGVIYKENYNGEETYQLANKVTTVLDGTGYTVMTKVYGKAHNFSFSNPDTYYKLYPEVDELVFMKEIIDTIRTEFGIWQVQE
ncbi:hypothetical protein [Pustulibacterium marinum]|nr:hypothetical protein [Pustulibacterium marinum]